MTQSNRVFIFGAGFSKPTGMPLATELVPLLEESLELDEDDEMRNWLDDIRRRLDWLGGSDVDGVTAKLNIEEVFHYAHFDREVWRLKQHLAPVGRGDGPGTPWNQAEAISCWLGHLEEALRDVIVKSDAQANLEPIARWAASIKASDSVLTFNYDTLVERALSGIGKAWHHGTSRDNQGVAVFKLHGSIDWIVAHRSESFSNLDLLFEKGNENRSEEDEDDIGSVEDDYRLWRCRSQDQTRDWIANRELQNGLPSSVGIAGLGAYKQLHQIPGLGLVWARGMRSLYEADHAVVVGFSMSDFDAMAQLQFGTVAQDRFREDRPLPVTVIEPFLNDDLKGRFRRVFRFVDFVQSFHEDVDWTAY